MLCDKFQNRSGVELNKCVASQIVLSKLDSFTSIVDAHCAQLRMSNMMCEIDRMRSRC